MYKDPLFLAVVAAGVAALANVYSTERSSNTNLSLEDHREGHERALEIAKTDDMLIVEATKLDVDAAKKKLCFLADARLLGDSSKGELIKSKMCAGSQRIDNITVPYSTGWMGGGHNQDEACARGLAALQPTYPGKRLLKTNANEESRRDILGRVEYNYHCMFSVGD